MPVVDRSQRGAALILEIIIYLVIVALIAVAVTSGVRAVRDLVFTSHAKGDIQVVQSWAEGKYAQDGKYPGEVPGGAGIWTYSDMPRLTTANGVTNAASIASRNGANAAYCILVVSTSISDTSKQGFWVTSANPSKIMQSNTATSVPAYSGHPDSGIPGLDCP